MNVGSRSRELVACAALAASFGCRTADGPRPPAVPAPPAAPVATAAPSHASAPPVMPDSVHWVRNSAEFRAASHQAFRWATVLVERAAAGRAPGTWAVSLDGDETVLDNSQYQKERSAIGQGFSDESWREWVSRKSAPALPGSSAFLRRVHELGGRIAIVTNRAATECADTEANFRARELPFDLMLCRPAEGPSHKEPRYDAIAAGTARAGVPPMEIVLWVGDNIQDFPLQRQDLRQKPDAAFADYGSRFVIIPNPMYGSWEKNPRE